MRSLPRTPEGNFHSSLSINVFNHFMVIRSKLNAVTKQIKDIVVKKEKVIVFVQWSILADHLVKKLSNDLKFNVMHLCGHIRDRQETLKLFRESTENKHSVYDLFSTYINICSRNHVKC